MNSAPVSCRSLRACSLTSRRSCFRQAQSFRLSVRVRRLGEIHDRLPQHHGGGRLWDRDRERIRCDRTRFADNHRRRRARPNNWASFSNGLNKSSASFGQRNHDVRRQHGRFGLRFGRLHRRTERKRQGCEVLHRAGRRSRVQPNGVRRGRHEPRHDNLPRRREIRRSQSSPRGRFRVTMEPRRDILMRRIAWSLFTAFALSLSTCAVAFAGTVIVNPQSVDTDALPSNPAGAMQAARQRVAAGDLDRAVREMQVTSTIIPAKSPGTIARGPILPSRQSLQGSEHLRAHHFLRAGRQRNAQPARLGVCDREPHRRRDRRIQPKPSGNGLRSGSGASALDQGRLRSLSQRARKGGNRFPVGHRIAVGTGPSV